MPTAARGTIKADLPSWKVNLSIAAYAGHVRPLILRHSPILLPPSVNKERQGVVESSFGECPVDDTADSLLHREAGMVNPRQGYGGRVVLRIELSGFEARFLCTILYADFGEFTFHALG